MATELNQNMEMHYDFSFIKPLFTLKLAQINVHKSSIIKVYGRLE